MSDIEDERPTQATLTTNQLFEIDFKMTTTIVTLAAISYLSFAASAFLFWAENRRLRKEIASLRSVTSQSTNSES